MEPASFNSLPVELVLNILEYLDFKAILAASSVSQQWLALTQTKDIIKKLKIFVQNEEQMECLLKSKRNFINLIFGYNPHNPKYESQTINEFPILDQFWSTCCNNIQYCCLDGINNLYLAVEGLSRLKNLQTLDFRNSKYFLEAPIEPEAYEFLISKCTLSISTLLLNADPHYEYMYNDEMEFLLAVTPKLKKLVIFSTKMSKFVMRYLQNSEFASSLQHLELIFSTENDDAESADHIKRFFLDLIEIKHLNLEYLEFGFSYETDVQFNHSERLKIEKFLKQQKNLKALKISGSELTGICCKLVFPKLPKLEVVKLDVTTLNRADDWPMSLASKNAFLESFKLFWKLKEAEFHYFTGYEHPIFESLIKPSILRTLTIWSTIQTVAGLPTFENNLKFLPILTNLTMTSCLIPDSLLQSIFKNLLSLKMLKLSAQDSQGTTIVDSSLTGDVLDDKTYSIANLKNLESFSIGDVSDQSELTDLCLKYFLELKSLKILDLNVPNKFSEDALIDFRSKSRAVCQIKRQKIEVKIDVPEDEPQIVDMAE